MTEVAFVPQFESCTIIQDDFQPRQAITMTSPGENCSIQNNHNYLSNFFLCVPIISNFLGAEIEMFSIQYSFCRPLGSAALGDNTADPTLTPSYDPGFHNALLICNNSRILDYFLHTTPCSKCVNTAANNTKQCTSNTVLLNCRCSYTVHDSQLTFYVNPCTQTHRKHKPPAINAECFDGYTGDRLTDNLSLSYTLLTK